MRQVLNDTKPASTTACTRNDRPILSADAREAAIALSEVLSKHKKAVDHRRRLEQDKAVLLDVGNQHFKDVVAVLKRCGKFVNKELEAAPNIGPFAERDKTLLRDLRTILEA